MQLGPSWITQFHDQQLLFITTYAIQSWVSGSCNPGSSYPISQPFTVSSASFSEKSLCLLQTMVQVEAAMSSHNPQSPASRLGPRLIATQGEPITVAQAARPR